MTAAIFIRLVSCLYSTVSYYRLIYRSWYSNEMIEDVLVNTRDNKRTVILINMFKITICNNMRILLCVCTIHTCLIVQTAVMSHREVHLDID